VFTRLPVKKGNIHPLVHSLFTTLFRRAMRGKGEKPPQIECAAHKSLFTGLPLQKGNERKKLGKN
jgi:hypothetical protein